MRGAKKQRSQKIRVEDDNPRIVLLAMAARGKLCEGGAGWDYIRDVAARANLSVQTVYSFYRGRTRKFHHRTVSALLFALGCTLNALQFGNDKPRTLEELASQARDWTFTHTRKGMGGQSSRRPVVTQRQKAKPMRAAKKAPKSPAVKRRADKPRAKKKPARKR